jgi:hypothetical protein
MYTDVVEFGIACEACHGPAQTHINANRNPIRRYDSHLNQQADPTIVQPERLLHRRASEVCGQCHSVSTHHTASDNVAWFADGFQYRPGNELAKTRYLVRANQDLDSEPMQLLQKQSPTFMGDHFWSDGMVRISGREYSGLLETSCFQNGELSCISCHQLHQKSDDSRTRDEWRNDQLKEHMGGNPACLQCHTDLATEPQLSAHSHHQPDSPGSLCYNCHMPFTTYGLLKTIRSHQIDSPNVAVSLKTGRPNACNLCHLDRTMAWTSELLAQWYGQTPATLGADQERCAASVLWTLTGDAGQRAIMAAALGWLPAVNVSGEGWLAPILAPLLNDRYDAVRIIAYHSLKRLPGFGDFEFDPMAPEDQRKIAVAGVQDRWQQFQLGLGQQSGGAEKMLPAIELDQAQIDQLWQQRDRKRVFLRE